jgi:ferredoxin-NADP reductase
MQLSTLRILERKWLTEDVFELIVAPSSPLSASPGQFSMFVLPSGLRRSYSISWTTDDRVSYIIKRLEGGKGSTELSELPIGSEFSTMPPLGHFVLSDGDRSRCFIGTGTGFAPLYCQARAMLERGDSRPALLVFGVRSAADVFYREELDRLANAHPNFRVRYFLSREEAPGYERGYVTETIGPELAGEYEEFYLCGSPAMVKDARAALEGNGVEKDRIRFEQY